ncbi:hypothetical protein HN51_022119 [Arachis hypogaea]|uniref:Uncharacterized protein n=1 Tax=Arachis hypogaea TaxID=3818 RepID=A0A445EEZ7_ARAHY|nr:golgin subfamily A member 6-like protein 6 [Arachis hypogaea]XP_057744206.1 uncharacterized protein LOC130962126 [Arachis stenosperma]QHO53265.1 uncharacterized protein DS421_2g46390 [Arachis hypogaea]RYR73879.1 hypothetical protein Ahy_A02g008433 [Arachis hypogaea]
MGGSVSKSTRKRRFSEKYVTNLKEKVMVLQEEIKDVMYEREKESRSYEREIMVFTFKEADWKQEGKRMREEVKMLRKMVEEKEERIRDLEEKSKKGSRSSSDEKEWEQMETKLLVEQMKEERVRRDEAVEKWKHLYLAIKTELDDLIHRTYHGDGLYWKAEEKEIQMETMKKELQDKEETIKALKSHLDSLEQEKYKKEREFDLLRQSLRIMNGKKCSVHKKEKIKKSRLGT